MVTEAQKNASMRWREKNKERLNEKSRLAEKMKYDNSEEYREYKNRKSLERYYKLKEINSKSNVEEEKQ